LFRILYFRSGELLTLAMFLAIGFYLARSLSDAGTLLENEQKAVERLAEISRLEKKSVRENDGEGFRPLKGLLDQSDELRSLEEISVAGEDRAEIYEDGGYVYYFKLIDPPKGVDDYISGREKRPPVGFEVIAWPKAFALTGEMAFYVTEKAKLAYTANEQAQYDGFRDFPPNLDAPRAALKRSESSVEYSTVWRSAPLNRYVPTPGN